MPAPDWFNLTRRDFLATSASGLGLLAMASLLREQQLLAATETEKAAQFPPKAKSCIFIFMEGAPSQMDLFDPKPKLNDLDGQKLPESMTKQVRFAFIQKESAVLMGSPRKFQKHRQCGMELSDLLPHLSKCVDDIALIRSMHTDQFNHHPGQLMMNTGSGAFGRPSIGSWLNYGLGSECRNLPVPESPGLRRAHRRTRAERRRHVVVERFFALELPGRVIPQQGRSGPEPRQSSRDHAGNAAPRDRSDWRFEPLAPKVRG
jgi:hypothetical protein